MEYCKMQLGCLVVLFYVAFVYIGECRQFKKNLKDTLFDELLTMAVVSVIFDGITAYTVNNLETVHPVVNKLFHLLYMVSLESVIFFLFLYIMLLTGMYPQKLAGRLVVFGPYVLSVGVIVFNIDSIKYIEGNISNYSSGISAYSCFIMAAVYIILSIVIFCKNWSYFKYGNRSSILTYLLVLVGTSAVQFFFNDLLVTSIGVTVFVLGIYMNSEDPALQELSKFHNETVISFAGLVESRDNSTGGHIKRTSRYVKLLAEELRKRGYYRDILTKDYIDNLIKAAPMHDIGKIAVSDAILQKPGKLTDEEYAEMKQHASKGGDIIREVFRNLGDEDYRKMAFDVARYHHEKWNGKGYPEGLQRKDIPLCARIMAVADVFDAISEKRCYRDAMPMDKCFEIIGQGSGQDFDPIVAETFIDIREKVEEVHSELMN
ncbi:MAG: HD domain-containing protein [Ruminiclostridium sp.]|nr:HD domain-containing protein [Ruminiclostridium sp.]